MEKVAWIEVKNLKLVSETTWSRIEGSPRADTPEVSLAAVIPDPYFMMARQWAFGELLGDEGTSPISTSITWKSERLGTPDSSAPTAGLLEADIESEPWDADLRLRVQAGQELAQLLDEAVYGKFVAAFPLPRLPPEESFPTYNRAVVADAATRAFHKAVFGRVPDGFEAIRSHLEGTLPTHLRSEEVRSQLELLVEWFGRTYPNYKGPSEASHWVPSELEYRTSIQAGENGTTSTLAVDDHHGGRLDWWNFDQMDPIAWDHAELRRDETLPTTVEIPGAPLPTYWQFEDWRVDFGQVSVAKTDLARMILSEFALIYGEDWFSVPLVVERGSVVRIEELEITNTFGERFLVPPSGGPSEITWDRWSTGHPTAPPGVDSDRDRLLVFPPATLSSTDGPAIEEVILARDEMANMLWGIEVFAANDLGEGSALVDFWGDHLMSPANAPTEPGLHYTLMTDVPAAWIPFSPRLDRTATPPRANAFEMIPFIRTGADGKPVAVWPLGALLSKEDPPGTYRLAEESVNRVAQRIVRRFERARGPDGRVHLWIANHRAPAQPQHQSGLRFDILTNVGQEDRSVAPPVE